MRAMDFGVDLSHLRSVATYVLAPVPNALCARCAGGDDLMSDYHRYVQRL